MSLEVEINEQHATYAVDPEHGARVVFEVRYREVNISRSRWRNLKDRYVVGLKGSDGDGFAHFTSFEKACRSALYRARRYEKAYSKPRGTRQTVAAKDAA